MEAGSRSRFEHVFVWILIFGAVGLLVAFVVYFFLPHTGASTQVHIGAKTFYADVADTDQRREAGLRGVSRLPEDRALLVKHPHDDVWPVRTEGLQFPIDIVWITAEKKVVFVARSAQPSQDTVYRPSGKSRYVLQLSEGSISRYNVSPGRTVEFEG